MTLLNLNNKHLTTLDGQNLENVVELWCRSNRISTLPNLYDCLLILDCAWNTLTELPILPVNLEFLHCYGNMLTKLPNLPDNLNSLMCYANKLTELPTLPSKLTSLVCFRNKLLSLPELPDSLVELSCYGNSIERLPNLPVSLTRLKDLNHVLNKSGLTKIKLSQHNKKRKKLGLFEVCLLPNEEHQHRINRDYTLLKYDIGGDKYKEALQKYEKLG